MGRVSGVVTLDGQAVQSGIVHFIPQAGPAAVGVLDESGHYQLTTYHSGDGAVTGKHTVFFSPIVDDAYMADYMEEDYMAGKLPPEPPQQDFLPEKYLAPATSGLSAEVISGSNSVDFSLTAK